MKYKSCTEYWLNTQDMTFRGEFEEMYHDIDDAWECKNTFNSLNNRIFIELLFDQNVEYKRILDIGCGLGGLTNSLFLRNEGYTVSIFRKQQLKSSSIFSTN